MVHTFVGPEWFLTYEFILHLAFGLITLGVSVYAFKVYRLIKQSQIKLFGFAFISYSLGCFIQALLEFFALTNLVSPVRTITEALLDRLLDIFGIYVHIIFFTVGLVTLAYMTLKVKSVKIYSLLLIPALMALIFAENQLILFYILSAFFLLYIVNYYLFNYLDHKQQNTFRILIAFILLLIGNTLPIFSILMQRGSETFYVIGHLVEGAAYLVILVNLILVAKNDKKTRQTANNTANP